MKYLENEVTQIKCRAVSIKCYRTISWTNLWNNATDKQWYVRQCELIYPLQFLFKEEI